MIENLNTFLDLLLKGIVPMGLGLGTLIELDRFLEGIKKYSIGYRPWQGKVAKVGMMIIGSGLFLGGCISTLQIIRPFLKN